MRHWVVWVALAGCVSSQSVPCDGELVCPQGTSCASVIYPSGAKPYCANADELAGCVGIADGAACSDGLAGCADPDCWYVCTPLCPPGVTSCP